QQARLPPGHGRARPPAGGPRPAVPRLPPRPRPGVSLVPLEEARARVLAACPPLRPSAVPLDEALGCVTSVPLTAEEDVPPFANTAIDGYAVRAVDTQGAPVVLTVVGTIAAGVRA